MEYTFKVVVDGCWEHEDVEFEKTIELSDSEVVTIKRLISEYDDELSRGLMPILEDGSDELFKKFHNAIFPQVFLAILKNDTHLELDAEDKQKLQDEDFDYLMEKFRNNYCFDDAYYVYIPDEMKPAKIKLSKSMSKKEIKRYVKRLDDIRKKLFWDIHIKHEPSNFEQEDLNEFIEKRLTEMVENDIECNDEATLTKEDFNPFENENLELLAIDIFEEFQKETKG